MGIARTAPFQTLRTVAPTLSLMAGVSDGPMIIDGFIVTMRVFSLGCAFWNSHTAFSASVLLKKFSLFRSLHEIEMATCTDRHSVWKTTSCSSPPPYTHDLNRANQLSLLLMMSRRAKRQLSSEWPLIEKRNRFDFGMLQKAVQDTFCALNCRLN